VSVSALSTVRISVSLLIAMTGAAVIGLVPYERWKGERDRRDLLRARAPLVKVSINEFQPDRDRTLEFILPTDRQWRRIVGRLGTPTVLLVVATDPERIRPQAYSATDGLSARATQNGRPLMLTPTTALPFAYSTTTRQTTYRFVAGPRDQVDLTLRLKSMALPNDAFVMVFPLWNPLEIWHWGDSTSMGLGMIELVAPVFVVLGTALIFIAVNVGLVPLHPTR
jgi:hypothetical protein